MQALSTGSIKAIIGGSIKAIIDNIPEPGEKGHAKNLKWMERLSELRRIPAHPSDKRHYKVEDFEYIDYMHGEFFPRLREAEKNPILEISEMLGDDDA